MIKFLAFLLILCILFGVEATRSLIFGTFGFIFWAFIILAGIGLVIDLLKDKRTPEQKETDAKKKAEQVKRQELEREKTIKKQKDWAKKHPKASNFLSGISNKPLLVSLAFALLFIAVLAVVFILLEK